MPELPEVETVVRALRDPLVGRTFSGFESYWPNQIVVPDDVNQLRAVSYTHLTLPTIYSV